MQDLRGATLAVVICTGALLGCTKSTEKGKLRPEGPPEIMEVMMFESVSDGFTSANEFNMAYGCGALNEYNTFDPHPCDPDSISSLASDQQPRMRLCCERNLYHPLDDGSVTNAVIGAGQKIRIIVDELLSGPTVEQFTCGCADPPAGTDANCQGGPVASLDPLNCEDNPNTDISEASRFSDANQDGVPDKTDLLPGILEVYCDGLTATWLNVADEGWYNPSGNQQVPANVQDSTVTNVVLEWDSIGPAIVISILAHPLPSNSDCHIRFREETEYETKDGMVTVPSARDKDGNAIPEPADVVTFHTQAMSVTSSVPSPNATNVPVTLPLVTVTFNTRIAPGTIDSITVRDMGGVDVPGTRSLSMDGAIFQFDPTADLAPSTQYTVTITTSVTDEYGGSLPVMQMFSFTTGT